MLPIIHNFIGFGPFSRLPIRNLRRDRCAVCGNIQADVNTSQREAWNSFVIGLSLSTCISEVPCTLESPGDYHLAESLLLEGGEYAIKVGAERVCLDLGGHTLENRNGIAILLEATHFSLENGTLKGDSIALISAPHIRPDNCRLRDLIVEGVLYLGGDYLVAERCRVVASTQGIRGGLHCSISDCEVSGALLGVEVGAGSEVFRTTVRNCEEGVYAYGSREHPVYLEKLLVLDCDGLGLRLDGPGTAFRCEVHNNGRVQPGGGILAGPASVVRECEAYGNNGGDISVVKPCELIDNRVTS